jgi:cell division protein ZapE
MSGPVRVAYDALIAANELKPDDAQRRAVGALDQVADEGSRRGLIARLFDKSDEGPMGV